jgi:hypothetical protein
VVVGETHNLHVVDLAHGDIGRQLIRKRLFLRRIDREIRNVHVADECTLCMRQVRDRAVVRPGARERGVPVAHVVGQQVMVLEVQKAHVPPETRVVLLRMKQQARPARRVRRAARLEVTDVRNALFLVDEQVVNDVEVLGVLLCKQRFRRAAVVAAVVHVHVQVGREELPEVRGEVVVLEADLELGRVAGRECALDDRRLAVKPALHVNRRLARRNIHLAAVDLGRTVEVMHLARELRPIVIRRRASRHRAAHASARRCRGPKPARDAHSSAVDGPDEQERGRLDPMNRLRQHGMRAPPNTS